MWPVSSAQEVCENAEETGNFQERLLVIKAAFYLSIPFIMILQNRCYIKRQPKSKLRTKMRQVCQAVN